MCDAMALLQNKLDMDAEEEQRGQKRKISLSSCDVCDVQEAKYCCPGCLKCSCRSRPLTQRPSEHTTDPSAFLLSCVKQHKLQSGCSGVRDRTAFIPLSRFGDLHMLSDYRFLEETGRVAERPNRDTMLHTRTRHSYGAMLLLRNAKAAKVNLKILPKSFSRRRENTSIYNKQYHELDMKKSLRENLMFKTVVEFPELYVAVKEHREEYRTRVPDGRIDSSRPPASSEARGAPESHKHTTETEKETTAQSELEEGEVQSEDEEDNGVKEEDAEGHLGDLDDPAVRNVAPSVSP
ncbi:box C/D snoRNA protein 1 isoform X5 [Tachysurus fulvidraco]|uniref:box C/D snoRNA protein 1 isoform X5 n=1 Tax=Tachysurus fulvidraco TaxID=1234273 RepID=UPI001FEF1750|nr:box C/D snoRNA protein 1 isoform X5 [Tachysurus fulvidraco]